MKTKTINLYTIKELKEVSPEGYKNAYYKYCEFKEQDGYVWKSEAIKSIEEFLRLFDCTLVSITFNSVYADDFKYIDKYISVWNEEEQSYELLDIEEIKGDKLKEYLNLAHGAMVENYQECSLTGYYLDFTLLTPLYEFMNGNEYQDYSLQDLIELSLHMALEEIDADIEYSLSYEAFEDYSECNECYYDIKGNLE